MQKTILAGLLAAGLTLAVSAQPIQTQLNGQPLQFDQPPTMLGGRVMVPLRGIFEALGATVQFNGATQGITATRADKTVQLTLGSTAASINGQAVNLDVPASTIGGRTMVPLRFVSEALGADVRWQEATQTVSITSGDTTANLPAPAPAPQPAPAPGPQLSSVQLNSRGPLHAGDTLAVTATGVPGGRASFDIEGIAQDQPMQEVRPGQYRGRFTVPNGLRAHRAGVVVHLRKHRQSVDMESPQSVTFFAPPAGPAPAPVGNLDVRVTNLRPGMPVPPVFNIQGRTSPFAVVTVTARSARTGVPGVVTLPGRALQSQDRADARGHFDVQLDASAIPRNTGMTVEVQAADPAGRQGAPYRFPVVRQ